MLPILLPLLWGTVLADTSAQTETIGSFLREPTYRIEAGLHGPTQTYLPQPGDLFFATDHIWLLRFGHWAAGADYPHHSGIIVRKPDGSLALLEAGPFNETFIVLADLLPILKAYEAEGLVWLRRRKVPLTAEQSAKLTEFAVMQEGKRFALWRMLGQVTLLRSRGAVRTSVLGKSHGPNRCSYFCSELLSESLIWAGVVDPDLPRPSATYPRDLFNEHSTNRHLEPMTRFVDANWYPPARWTSTPCGEQPGQPPEHIPLPTSWGRLE
jgi:hypothetical protein